ncbi:unnamed protein product (macronuclear) [Paramecium tetraurelia]|uniref:G-protein coupled receptors family 1 profile domain-containing protein n=1 Tax=Paramecium tetraurelia TaxID=5888 RepID=A0D4P1_PARTE|nr:uncharacterized protein GSPATT00013455001 [Paramecium tetraurelia]CAK78008.1 unnamed protein product [Paramecium tetraurelia]|eukprot:XP_001445405.1 hypothetical protein (macronuclear) [Paramecium tetraurelia strain d4-2]
MNDQTIKILQITACSLSLIGSLFIVVVYFKMGMRNNFALKLIMCLTISDIIFSLSNLMYIDPGCTPNYQILCTIQGFLIQYSSIACFIFCFLLCLCIFWTVIRNRANLSQYQRCFQIIGFCIPILFALIPAITNSYNTQIYVCGISNDDVDLCHNKSDKSSQIVMVESILLFYVPLWLMNIVGISFIIRVSVFMTKLRTQSELNNRSRSSDQQEIQLQTQQEYELKLSQRITQNMLLYPIIMLICYSGMTVYAIGKLCNSEIVILRGLRFIMADCLGLCNSIAYGYNAIIILRLQKMMSQQQTLPMMQFRQGSNDSDVNRKQFESFLSIATIYNDQ